jgi:hypothetical protein
VSSSSLLTIPPNSSDTQGSRYRAVRGGRTSV